MRIKHKFEKFYLAGIGHVRGCEIEYYLNMPRGPKPYDVNLTPKDDDAVNFTLYQEKKGLIKIEYGTEKSVPQDRVILRGCFWTRMKCLATEQHDIYFDSYLELEKLVKETMNVDLSEYRIFPNCIFYILPSDLKAYSIRFVRHTRRLLNFHENKANHQDYNMDGQNYTDDILSTIHEYTFLVKYKLTGNSMLKDIDVINRLASLLKKYS